MFLMSDDSSRRYFVIACRAQAVGQRSKPIEPVEDAMEEFKPASTHLLLAARCPGLAEGRDNVLEVLVRVQAPDANPETEIERPSIALALVIDRSGSMAGTPLHEAKQCARYVVASLRPTDRLSVIQFDNRVDLLWPACPVGDGRDVLAAIDRIASGGNTNLHGGWLAGAESLQEIEGSGVKRVLLLSDGCANVGTTDSDTICGACAQWAAKGITTSTYGLGNHFNEEMMLLMARAGGGSNYYGDTAQDLIDPFQREMGLLANLYLRNVQLAVAPLSGVQITMLNDLPRSEAGWRLPDIAFGAEAWAVLRLQVPAAALPPEVGCSMLIAQVVINGLDATGKPIARVFETLELPLLAEADVAALPENELVLRRLIEIQAAQALQGIRLAARDRRWDVVDQLLLDALQRFAANDWVAQSLRAMQEVAASRSIERTSKEAYLSSSRMHARLADKDEDNQTRDESGKMAYLRRKSLQGKNGP
jgi:Ca-activated chloride channel family protein